MIWAVFLRPIPVRTASGVIVKKTFKPADTYWEYPVGLDRGFRTANPIPIAEAEVMELTLDGFEGPAYYALNTVASKAFEVGQRVKVQYKERTIPFAWKRLYILDMTAAK